MLRPGCRLHVPLLSLLLLTSCAAEFEITSDHLLMACDGCRRQGVPVDVLWHPPDRPFTAIAHVEAGGTMPDPAATWEAVKLALCREAHKVGADAVVIGAWQYEGDSWTVGPFGYGGQAKLLRGLAIRHGAK